VTVAVCLVIGVVLGALLEHLHQVWQRNRFR
jgi:hypothetical protein